MTSVIPISLDDYFSTATHGSIQRALTNTLYGINHQQITPKIETPKDRVGLLFLTRPQLNLSEDNIRGVRKLYRLLSGNKLSVERYVRVMLDPHLQNNPIESERIDCPIVDPKQAFIPFITNLATGTAGWPDIALSTYVSPSGNWKEQYAQIDGVSEIYEAWDTDITIKNMGTNLPLYLIYVWAMYSSMVFEGRMVPYDGYLSYNIIDYMTRLYRLVLDRTGKRVTMIAATGVSFPKAVPVGAYFDYNRERPYNEQVKEITLRFQSLGAEYLDDILVKEFNEVVAMFNPDMREENREANMVKIPDIHKKYFNHRGYPRINTNTMELEWWIGKTTYENKLNLMLEAGLLTEV